MLTKLLPQNMQCVVKNKYDKTKKKTRLKPPKSNRQNLRNNH